MAYDVLFSPYDSSKLPRSPSLPEVSGEKSSGKGSTKLKLHGRNEP